MTSTASEPESKLEEQSDDHGTPYNALVGNPRVRWELCLSLSSSGFQNDDPHLFSTCRGRLARVRAVLRISRSDPGSSPEPVGISGRW